MLQRIGKSSLVSLAVCLAVAMVSALVVAFVGKNLSTTMAHLFGFTTGVWVTAFLFTYCAKADKCRD